MKKTIGILLLVIVLLLASCNTSKAPSDVSFPDGETIPDLGGFDDAFGEDVSDLGIYDGYFEEVESEVEVSYISGSDGCYKIEGNTLTFSTLSEDSVYSISGQFKGNIIIDIGDDYKLDLEMKGFSLICDSINPITVLSGKEVSLTAKKDYENYIYDNREAIDESNEALFSGAIHSEVDLEICGKGALTVISANNNGIHSKDDLQIKNLTLFVSSCDNALKGNDSVEIEGGNTTIIATAGDGIKTSNSNISDKGNQRGTVTVTGGEHTIYAACDGIDAAYDVIINDNTTVLNIYTDKYSSYSEEVTAVDDDNYYIRFTYDSYYYSVKYYNSDDDYLWVNAEYHSKASGGRTSYYYYAFPKMPEYAKMQFFIYDSEDDRGQEEECLVMSDYLSPSEGYDTFALTSSYNGLYYTWTNYTTTVQEGGFGGHGGMGGFGGMNDGNTDKGDHSTKGIKAANEVIINDGTVTIKAYDDAIHANADTALENGETPKGNLTINGGNVTVYSNDDGLHADGVLTIAEGTVTVTNSYEGLEGSQVVINGGDVSVISKDDGINATVTSGNAVAINGGKVYIYCSGDGIDSNSRTSYQGIVFSGGDVVVISTSGGNSAIDTEQGYSFTGGRVVAVMPSGGMSSEATHCQNFSSVGINKTLSLSSGTYLTVEDEVTIKMPASINGRVIYLGNSSASVSTASSSTANIDKNGVCWE
ncbi:MAG: carbohydrate-binding domain-containing protein [Clostridia bacterium]|nr:carbohydrate-binding domain-containing protein [Clostridia bacterium]